MAAEGTMHPNSLRSQAEGSTTYSAWDEIPCLLLCSKQQCSAAYILLNLRHSCFGPLAQARSNFTHSLSRSSSVLPSKNHPDHCDMGAFDQIKDRRTTRVTLIHRTAPCASGEYRLLEHGRKHGISNAGGRDRQHPGRDSADGQHGPRLSRGKWWQR